MSSNRPGCWGSTAGPGGQATNKDLKLQFDPIDMPESEDDDEDEDDDGGKSGESKILKLFESPLFNNQSMSDYFRKMFGGSRSARRGCRGRRDDGSLHPAGAARSDRMPVPCPPGSNSPMTANPVRR